MGNRAYGMVRAAIAILMVCMLGLFIFSAVLDDREWVTDQYFVVNGEMDLNDWDARAQITRLDGNWKFYWKQFSVDLKPQSEVFSYVKTPDSWENMKETGFDAKGFATYQMTVKGLVPNGRYGLRMLDQVTAYRLKVNEKLVAYNGQIGRSAYESIPEWRPVITRFSADANGEASFEMEISNFEYSRGGFWNSIFIGDEDLISSYSKIRTISETFLFAGLFVMAAFFMGMHSLYPHEKDTVAFSLFCLMMSIQVAFTGERIIHDFMPWLSWGMSLRLEYLSGYVLMPLFGMYVAYRFPKDASPKMMKFFVGIGIILSTVTIIFPHEVYASLIEPVKYLSIGTAPYFAWVFYKVRKEGRNGSQLMMAAFVILFLSLIKDTLFKSEFSALPYGAFIFMIAFSLITISKYVWVQKNNDILEKRVIRDPLTGVFNRSYLDSFMEFDTKDAYYVLFLDLDGFKKVNDQYGHDVGDRVLKEASKRIRRQVRTSDIVCRYGGDEFVILVLDESDVEIDQIAERIVLALNEPMPENMFGAQIGASIGISHYPEDGLDLNDLIRRSDLEMYRKKLEGGNGHHRHRG